MARFLASCPPRTRRTAVSLPCGVLQLLVAIEVPLDHGFPSGLVCASRSVSCAGGYRAPGTDWAAHTGRTRVAAKNPRRLSVLFRNHCSTTRGIGYELHTSADRQRPSPRLAGQTLHRSPSTTSTTQFRRCQSTRARVAVRRSWFRGHEPELAGRVVVVRTSM